MITYNFAIKAEIIIIGLQYTQQSKLNMTQLTNAADQWEKSSTT